MEIKREWLEELIFEGEASRRFTQDSPVLPDVWIRYAMKLTRGKEPILDLLLTPHAESTAGRLYLAVEERLELERGTDDGPWARLHSPQGPFRKLLEKAKKAVVTPEEPEDASDDTACDPESPNLAYNQSTVVGCFHLAEVVRVLLPLTDWWRKNVCREPGRSTMTDLRSEAGRKAIERDLERLEENLPERGGPVDLLWLVRLVGGMLAAAEEPDSRRNTWEKRREKWNKLLDDQAQLVKKFRDLVLGGHGGDPSCPELPAETPLFMVSRNRRAKATVAYSVQAVKADAARRVFQADCSALAWAVLDSGIDAEHPAFRKRDAAGKMHPEPFRGERPGNHTRVEATFDFTRIRLLLSGSARQLRDEAARIGGEAEKVAASLKGAEEHRKRLEGGGDKAALAEADTRIRRLSRLHEGLRKRQELWAAHAREDAAESAAALKAELLTGQAIRWERIRELLEVPHEPGGYVPPVHEHGTHVAGILAADWKKEDWDKEDPQHPSADVVGVCPDIRVYDFRVFDEGGSGDEFTVMAALQFLRHLNAHRELPLIHGANLSLAIRHDVANYACGRTPVCDACERVVKAGVVVVAAAGNYGYHRFSTLTDSGAAASFEGYADISITDPGNAEAVITVGSTHRIQPHTYGVSYFSSRGPTGDGRYKPDLVAPGEKITAPVPGNAAKVKDGTSMAAPHVSGAAAMILARHNEFIGQPARIKQILCDTATDLGRDRYFQGAGMVDVLRALQSV